MNDTPTTLTPEAAREQIASLKTDRAFSAAYANGDVAARQRWDALHQAAQPAAPAPGKPAEESGELAASFAKDFDPPASPAEYDLSSPAPDIALDETAVMGMAETLHEAGVPRYLVQVGFKDAIRRMAENDGQPLSDEQIAAGRETCQRFLETRHGAQGAREIMEAARSVVGPIVRKHPEIADWLEESGAGNDPSLILALASWARTK